MDEKTLNELKEKLLSEKKRLEKDLEKIAQKDDEGYDATVEQLGRSPEDNAEEVEEYATNLSVTETLEKSLNEVNRALDKMEKGIYGKCENCDKDVPLELLMVYPAARNCLDCAEK
jgi:RNA polymerase-binding transcription factor DksA